MWKQYLVLTGLVACLLASCRKGPEDGVVVDPPVVTAPLTVKFANTVDGQTLVLNSKRYKNANGDSFSVKTFKYYISNVSFNTGISSYAEPNSYHLIRAGEDSTLSFTVSALPAGTYTSVSFLIGVDKARNTSGAQTGALDPIYGMFWDWNTGYIMAKLEGDYSNPLSASGAFEFHISGYNTNDNVLKWVTIPLTTPAVVAVGKLPVINIQANVNEWFINPQTIDISRMHSVTTTGTAAMSVADNYADMFSLKSVVN